MSTRKRIDQPGQLQGQNLVLKYLDPKTLKANEKNWRVHSRRQRQAYQALKSKVSWAGACLMNETTGRLLDGHMRVDEAIKNNEPLVPVLVGSWTEEQENLILQQLDPIGALASTNADALASLAAANEKQFKSMADENSRKLAQLSQDLQEAMQNDMKGPLIPQSKAIRKPKEEVPIKDKVDEEDAVYTPPQDKQHLIRETIDDDVRFPSFDTRLIPVPLQIPSLQLEWIAPVEALPTQTFNRSRSQDTTIPTTYFCISSVPWPDDRDGGVLGFFTEDYRFEHVWNFSANFAEELLEDEWAAICAPDFSTYDDITFPEKLWAVYRSRWCARYWQGLSMFVIPTIQYMQIGSADMTKAISVDTLPDGCPTIAVQTRSLTDYEGFADIINYAVETKGVQGVLIYGGEEKKKYIHGHLTTNAQMVYLPSFMASRRKALKEQ